ncbi:MAG: asparagine synthase (glutamine-hydrolyzing) [Patescibacteria group bacterium]
MCGIFGIIGKNYNESIELCLNSMKHRGPDDTGQYRDNNIVLGFNRLSIIDLSHAGHQPMTNENKSIWIVFNGEIYNYLDIKNDLSKKHHFNSETDTEVLLHGYEEYGIDGLLEKINGMFALCIYDKKENITYLVRDRVGKKPLYYYLNDKYLSFSSEVKAFFELEKFPFEIDREMFDLFMRFPYLPDNNKTIIKNVYKVSPGCYMKISDGLKTETVSYWNLPQKENNVDFDSAKKQLEDLLIDSVNKRLVADVPVGILLSGGLDSSLITALASKYSKKKIKTINISYENSCIDERKYAKIVAKHCNTEHYEMHLSISDVYKEFKKNIWIYDDLSTADSGLFSEFLLAKKIKEINVKVVLVGEGADEIFGGYTWFQFALYPFKLLPNFINTIGYYYVIMRSLSGKKLIKYSQLLFKKFNETSGNFFRKIQRYEVKYSLPNHYCMKVDKGTSAASIEARAPFMDYRIVELACQLKQKFFLGSAFFQPWKAKEKYILRKIAEKYLPKEIYERKKKGGMLPVQEILDLGLKKDSDKILKNELLVSYYGKSFLEKLINEKPKNKIFAWRREWVLWKCLVFSLWFDYNSNNRIN